MTTLLLAFLATAQAAPPAPICDGRAFERVVVGASPSQMADAWLALAKCDPVRARKNVGRMKNMLPEASSIPAAVQALRIGLGDDVRDWIGAEMPDVRSRFVGKLGDLCKDEPELLTSWFEQAAADLGKQFYEERWHRGLDDCRTPGVQKLLTEALTSDVVGRSVRRRGEYFSVVEVWARNLGKEAVPKLAELLASAKDDEEAALFVNAFADAARVGSADFDHETAAAAADAIVAGAPKLQRRGLDRARDTLMALGAKDKADSLAKYAWADRYVDGAYTWAVTLVEDAACKNGTQRTALHLGTFTEAGATWRDGLEPGVKDRLIRDWAPDVGAKCKGTSTFTATLSPEPVDAEKLKAFQDEARAAFAEQSKAAKKATEITHPVFGW